MTLTALDMMKGWVEDLTVKNRALEEEIKILKLTNVTLTQELEMEKRSNRKTSVNVETQVDEVTRSPEHRRKVQSANGSDADMNSGQQIPRPTSSTSTGSVSERGETSEKSEFTQYIQTELSSMDEDMEIDIKEEGVGYGQSKSKQDCDNSIHDPPPLGPSGDFRTEVETDCEPNRSLSSHLARNVLCQEIVEHQPQVSSQPLPLCGRKKPYLTTRTAEKIHTCETCSAVFDTQFKLREHNKTHIGEKESHPSIHHKTPVQCYLGEKDFSTKGVSASHMKTHTEEKSVQVDTDDKGFSAKRSLTEEMENVNQGGHPKKQRNVTFLIKHQSNRIRIMQKVKRDVESSASGSDSESGSASGSAAGKSESGSGSSSSGDEKKVSHKKHKSSAKAQSPPPKKKKTEETEWTLGKNRKINVREFKGTAYVDIREYYMARDGELRPGKKGISLPVGQWRMLKELIPDIDAALKRF